MVREAQLRGRLVAGGTILSLILCLATVGLWVRSYWRSDIVERERRSGGEKEVFGMTSSVGRLLISDFRGPLSEVPFDPPDHRWYYRRVPSAASLLPFTGSVHDSGRRSG